jgi:hypothetical protein
MTKVTYLNAEKKKAVREFMFSFFNESSIIGLAGPDINDYLEWCKSKGFVNVEIFESNPQVMMKQLAEVKTDIPVHFKFSDILNAERSSQVVYDLDFCSTVLTLYDHIKKFRNEKFVMTFCTRAVGNEETVFKFFKERKEKILNKIEKYDPVHHMIIRTAAGKYLAAPYFDDTPMISIAKI